METMWQVRLIKEGISLIDYEIDDKLTRAKVFIELFLPNKERMSTIVEIYARENRTLPEGYSPLTWGYIVDEMIEFKRNVFRELGRQTTVQNPGCGV